MDKEKITYLNVNIDKFWILSGPTKISAFFIRPNKRPYPIASTLCKLKIPIIFARGCIVIKKTVCIDNSLDSTKDGTESFEFLTVLMEHQTQNGEKLYSLEDPGTRFNFEPESFVVNYQLDEQEECIDSVPNHYTFFNNPSKHLHIEGYKRLGKNFDERYSEMDWLIDGKFMIEREVLETKNKQLLQKHLGTMKTRIEIEKEKKLFGDDDGW